MPAVFPHVRLVSSCMALALAAVATESAAATPRAFCYPVMPGDTIASISVRLTRDPQGWRRAGFQILDPAAARFVSKEDYRYLHAGWQACVAEQTAARQALPPLGWWLLVLLSATALTGLFVVEWLMERRKATSLVLRTFGAEFIREFERPLIDQRAPRSVLRAELALWPDKGLLEVLLAPIAGRRYPNLSDHRTNVEYDVERVVTVLNDRRFVCEPLRTRGSWVAIRFRLKPDLSKEGEA